MLMFVVAVTVVAALVVVRTWSIRGGRSSRGSICLFNDTADTSDITSNVGLTVNELERIWKEAAVALCKVQNLAFVWMG